MSTIYTPITGEVIAEIPDASLLDVDAALDLASNTFESWRNLSASERGRILIKVGQIMRDRADEIAEIETLNTGKRLADTKREAIRAAECFEYYGGYADKITGTVVPVPGEFHAYTEREHTSYQARVLDEHLPEAASVIGELIFEPLLRQADLALERKVILEEISMVDDTPDDIIFDHFQHACFPDQAMGRPTLGTEEIIEKMPREALTGYMARHYGPSRMVVAAAGALDHDALLGMMEKHFIKARQRRGIDAAKLRGNVYKGRPASIDPAQIIELRHQGLGASEIAKRLKIGRASVYRALAA